MKRLQILTLALLLSGGLAAPALAAPDDMTLGKADAKVTVIEYASTTCSHCARWSQEVFPEFKKKYVDTGKVRYVLRELPTPPEELAAAGFLVARCAGGRYFEVVDDLWRDQAQLFKDRDAKGWLLRAGAKVGMDEAKVAGCVNDQAQQQAFEAREDANLKDKQVGGTPAIFVGSVKVGEGEIAFDTLSAEIDKQLKAAPAKPAAKHAKRKKR